MRQETLDRIEGHAADVAAAKEAILEALAVVNDAVDGIAALIATERGGGDQCR